MSWHFRSDWLLLAWVLCSHVPLCASDTGPTEAASDASAESAENEDEEYFELLKLFADTIDQVERNYVDKVNKRELMEAAIKGVLSKLDPYSDYIPPDGIDDFRKEVESEFGGIGIRVGMEKNRIFVITPLYKTPAHRAGIVAGDHILKIDGKDTSGLALDDAIQLMKGRIGTSVQLTVRHNTGTTQELAVERQVVQLETVMGRRRLADGAWDFILDADRKIGYLRVASFSRTTPDELRAALLNLEKLKAKGIILDLRFNPGGLLASAIEIADFFLDDGVIVGASGRNVEKQTWTATKGAMLESVPLVVLVNHHSASASEIVSAAMQDRDRAIVVGNRTWGKGSVQNIIELEGGRSALKLTTASYTRPSGKNIHRFPGMSEDAEWGVTPNSGFSIALTGSEIRELINFNYQSQIIRGQGDSAKSPYRDRQLKRAEDHLVATITKAKP